MKTRDSTIVVMVTATLSLIGVLFLLLSPGEAQADPGPGVDAGTDGPGMLVDPAEPEPIAEIAQTSSSASDDWEIECVNCPKYFEDMTDRSLRLDEVGHPHVAYGGDHLYYAWHDGSQWHREIVDDTPGVGRYASLALDSSGHPHISYSKRKWATLRYARYDGTAWHIETLDTHLGSWLQEVETSLAIGANDEPHISYLDRNDDTIKYAYREGGSWVTETVDAVGAYGADPSLALDSGDQPHIGYFDEGSDDVRHARRDGSAWVTETVEHTGYSAGYPSLALDSSDRPRISYWDGGDDKLRYAYWDGSEWITETVDSAAGYDSSITFDSGNQPKIAYVGPSYDLMYANLDGSAWHTNTVDTGRCADVSLALDPADEPQITYFEGVSDDLRHAYVDGSGWHTGTVDSSSDVGQYASLALDGQNDPHISYYDASKSSLEYAYSDASGWHSETVASGLDGTWHGRYGSLALEATAPYTPHVSYCRGQSLPVLPGCRGLKHARLGPSGWEYTTVEPGGLTHTAGQYSSLALSRDGRPQIAYVGDYEDLEEDVVKHVALGTDGAWWWSMVSRHESMWAHPSLALSPNDAPRVAYQDEDYHLKFAYPLTDKWTTQVVDPNESVGRYSSLAMDDGDHPHISYLDLSNFDLKYAHHDGVQWYIETVDTHSVGNSRDTSLALDSEGHPHIGYVGNTKLKYARYDGDAWHLEIVDTEGLPGYYLSLALGDDDQAHIAYYDRLDRDLKYAHVPGEHNIFLPLVVRNLSTP